ncbi:MAG: hypothetical protein HRU70_03860 [Phycisphaeraceae bacterium]|nr:MAG: hypothetical protein HRU70_03860 [Phycisphaeraceae bacterium]
MRVLLDGEMVPVDRPTLQAALTACASRAERRGRIIVSAAADGLPIPDSLLAAPPDTTTDTAELTFVSATPAAVVAEMFRNAAEALGTLTQAQREAADLVRAGRHHDAGDHLQLTFSIWQALYQAVQSGSTMIGIDMSEPIEGAGGKSPSALIAELAATLGEVKRAIEHEDWSALGDALAHDLDEAAGRWAVVTTALAEACERGA